MSPKPVPREGPSVPSRTDDRIARRRVVVASILLVAFGAASPSPSSSRPARSRPGPLVQASETETRTDPSRIADRIREAETLAREGRIREAVLALDSALEIDPDDVSTRIRLGTLLIEAGAVAEAVGHLEQAVRLDPESVEARRSLALAFHRGQELRRAVEEYERAIALDPTAEELYLELAAVLREGQLPGEAERFLAGVAERFPTSRWVRAKLGEARFEAGDIEGALASFTTALELPRAPGLSPETDRERTNFIYKSVGDMYVHQIRFDEARAAYTRALEYDPGNLDVRISLGLLYLRRNLFESALSEYAQVIEERPASIAAWHGRAEASLRLGHFEDSIAAADAAIRLDDRHLASHYVRAIALIRSGRYAEGRAAMEAYQALEIRSREDEERERGIGTFYKQALARLFENDTEGAIRAFREGLASYPDARELHWNLGLVQLNLGRSREAVATFQTMIGLGLDDAEVHRNLAAAYAQLGEAESSRRHMEIYLERTSLPDGP